MVKAVYKRGLVIRVLHVGSAVRDSANCRARAAGASPWTKFEHGARSTRASQPHVPSVDGSPHADTMRSEHVASRECRHRS